MKASERLREWRTPERIITPIFRKTDTIMAGANAFTRDRDTERLLDALPLIADVVEAAEREFPKVDCGNAVCSHFPCKRVRALTALTAALEGGGDA